MRSTVSRSLAAVAAGAALTLAPVGAAFADGHVAPAPDVTKAFDQIYNQADTWEKWLLDEEGIVATCEKTDDPVDEGDPFVVPPQPSSTQYWSLVVVKAGADDAAHEGWLSPKPGWELAPTDGKDISHVIVCTSDVKKPTPSTTTTTTPATTTTTTTTTTKPATGPVVETDRPAGGDSGQLGLFAGAAALLAAASALALNRRRQSAEH